MSPALRLACQVHRAMLPRLFLALAYLLLAPAATVRANDALDLGRLDEGVSLGDHSFWYKDDAGSHNFEQVSAADFAHNFVATGSRPISLGFSKATVWLRFEAHNRRAAHRSWLLELAYPHLDHVTLYVVHANGKIDIHETGDMLPFARREVAYPNFLFPLDHAALEHV